VSARKCTCRWLKRWPDGTVQWDLHTEGSEFIKCPDCCRATTLNAPQPAPVTDDAGSEVWPSLLAEVALSPELRALCEERDALGRAKYGTPLRAHNGRDALKDALQEALDLAAYLQQAAMEVEDAGRCFRGARFRDWRDVALDIARDLLGEVTP